MAYVRFLVGRERLFWPRLDRTGVRSLEGMLFWHKCLGLMNTFVKDELAQEVPIMEEIKQDDPFMRLRPGSWLRHWTCESVSKP